jgi:hypothetical protein
MLSQFHRYGLGDASALEYPVPTVSEADHALLPCSGHKRRCSVGVTVMGGGRVWRRVSGAIALAVSAVVCS